MKRRAVIICLLTVAVWLPSLAPYTPAGEDYGGAHVTSASVEAYSVWFMNHLRTEGAWRIVGLPITDIARHTHPLAFPVLALVFHALNGVLLMVWLQRLRAPAAMLLVAPLLFVTVPSAIEANMYAVAAQSVLTTTVFLLLACYLTAALDAGRATIASVGCCFAATFMGNAIQENLMFSYIALPAAIAYVQRPLKLWDRAAMRTVGALTTSALAAIAMFAAATLEVGNSPTKSPSINPETLISFVAYQVTNLIPFEYWQHRDVIGFTIEHQSVARIAVAAGLVMAAAALLRTVEWSDGAAPSPDARARGQRLFQAMLMLWICAGLVYLVGGGYSFESRKKYVTLAFMASAIAYGVSLAFDAARSAASRRAVIATVVVVIGISAATTWMIASLWILTAQRGEALVQAIVMTSGRRVHVRRHPDIYAAWPRWRAMASSQHNAAWVTEFEMLRRFDREIAMVDTDEEADVIIDCETLDDGPNCVVTPR